MSPVYTILRPLRGYVRKFIFLKAIDVRCWMLVVHHSKYLTSASNIQHSLQSCSITVRRCRLIIFHFVPIRMLYSQQVMDEKVLKQPLAICATGSMPASG